MARVRFTKDFDYHPTSQSTVEYLAGMEMTVKRECADQAISAGKAVELDGKGEEKTDGEAAIGG